MRFRHILPILVVLALASAAHAQTALARTTLSNAITSNTTSIRVASATGITAGSTVLLIDQEGLFVNSVNGTVLGVQRGYSGTRGGAHASGAAVLAGPQQAFVLQPPQGSCTNGQGLFLYSPVVSLADQNQWLCSTVTGRIVPGFGNTSRPLDVTTAVASAAGLITPSGPLFHITGTAAITGFNLPVGFQSGRVCAIPDGTFTTTTANNIALASTAVVSKVLCWDYDTNAAKFYPSY